MNVIIKIPIKIIFNKIQMNYNLLLLDKRPIEKIYFNIVKSKFKGIRKSLENTLNKFYERNNIKLIFKPKLLTGKEYIEFTENDKISTYVSVGEESFYKGILRYNFDAILLWIYSNYELNFNDEENKKNVQGFLTKIFEENNKNTLERLNLIKQNLSMNGINSDMPLMNIKYHKYKLSFNVSMVENFDENKLKHGIITFYISREELIRKNGYISLGEVLLALLRIIKEKYGNDIVEIVNVEDLNKKNSLDDRANDYFSPKLDKVFNNNQEFKFKHKITFIFNNKYNNKQNELFKNKVVL